MAAPLVPLVLSWLVGLFLGEQLPLVVWHWLGLALLAPLLVLGSARRASPREGGLLPSSLYTMFLALALTLGAARAASHRPDFTPHTLATYNDLGSVTIRGTIIRYPEARGSYTRYEVEASTIEVEALGLQEAVAGRFLVNLPPYPPYRYGDELRLSGELITPPILDDFDYRAFLAHKGIYSLLRQGHGSLVAQGQGSLLFHVLFSFRQRAEQTIQQLLPEPHASLMSGILLGIESGIPDEVMAAFNTTGTTHVLVISGSNFAILSAIFLLLGRSLLGEKRGSLVAIAAILLYALLVGGDPPVMRAAIMGIVSILALLLRREGVALNTLAFAVLVMTALQPGQLHDVGFQLSVLATVGLILLVNPLTGWTERLLAHLPLPEATRARVLPLLGDALLITLAAQVITTPLIVGTFGRFSVISLLTNLLILPVQSWLLTSGGIATLAGMLWLPLGRVLAAIPYAALSWTLAMVRWTAQFPYANLTIGPFPTWCIWSLYALAGIWWYSQVSGSALPLPRSDPAPAPLLPRRAAMRWGGALLVAFLPWWVGAQQADGRLHLYALDVGQGDALLIVAPDGKQILIDGGPDPVPLLAELGEQLPPWDRTIELVILSHADADHLAGLPELLSRYRLVQVMDSGYGHTTALYSAWERALAAQSLAPLAATPGQRWHLGDGAMLEVLAPSGEPFESLNDNAVVLRLRYGQFCALLTGDIEAEAEARLVRSGQLGPCQLLKVAHHGSKSSSTQPFLNATRPTYALISAGKDNRFGHPHAEVLARLEAMGVRLFRTDTQGTIHLMTDGQGLWISGEK